VLNSVSHLMESGTGFCLPERRQKKGWSLTFGRTATAVFASLAIAGTPAMAAYAAAQQGSGPAGNDVSYPQCGKTLPSGQAFGIVAVNEGLANNTNPCLAAENCALGELPGRGMADGKRVPAGSAGPLTPGLLALTITAIPIRPPKPPPQEL